MKKILSNYLDDLLLILGCGCILYGLAQWNAVITWIVAGLMMIVWGVTIGILKREIKELERKMKNDH